MKGILETMYFVVDLSSNHLCYSTESMERRFLCSESASMKGWRRGKSLAYFKYRVLENLDVGHARPVRLGTLSSIEVQTN
jgi:hypothetical protein